MAEPHFADGSKLLRSISILGYEERDHLRNAYDGAS
jgi:hypothetical protein